MRRAALTVGLMTFVALALAALAWVLYEGLGAA
jgi:hypothetical protein